MANDPKSDYLLQMRRKPDSPFHQRAARSSHVCPGFARASCLIRYSATPNTLEPRASSAH